MAVYTAKKVNPRTEGNLFKIDVQIFADGHLVKTQTFETSQDQPEDWPGDGVKRLIDDLQSIPALPEKITAGDIVMPPDPVVDEAANDWQSDYALLSRAKLLIDLGILAKDNADYVAVLERVTKNFKPEYIGLI